jgi:hypothetical protein
MRMVRTLPNGTLLRVEGVAHAPTLTEPDAMAGLEAFLSAPLPSQAGRG